MNPTRTLAALAVAATAACNPRPVVETEPVALTPPSFQYPEELWDEGVEGRTVLRILITETGSVDSARVETPSGHAAFDSAALAGTPALRFEPAKRDGTPVRKWVLLPVEFDITPADSAARPQAARPAATPADTSAAAQETPTQ